MNYSNMIEEKNLKKTFIIATLCSTLIGTFTSSIGLWDRVAERRKQGKRDNTQDSELKQLRERVEAAEKRSKRDGGDAPKEDRRRLRGPYDEEDAIGDNLVRSSALIQRQFDEGFGRLGSRFAQGDTLTENALQKQIIALQQTVIQVLQDALASNRQLSRADMARLVAASNAAREGSIAALRDQQYRLAAPEAAMPPMRALTLEEAYPPRSHSSSPRSQILALPPPPKRASTIIEPADPLFCPYALQLQLHPSKPLSSNFAPGGPSRCPTCTHILPVSGTDFWQIGKRTPVVIREHHHETEVMETREFHLGQRFVVKCHTDEGEFACVLCSRFRDRDAICRTVEGLVNHVGTFHDVGELEGEADLKETVVVPVGSVVGGGGGAASSVAGRSRAVSRAGSVRERGEREYR